MREPAAGGPEEAALGLRGSWRKAPVAKVPGGAPCAVKGKSGGATRCRAMLALDFIPRGMVS